MSATRKRKVATAPQLLVMDEPIRRTDAEFYPTPTDSIEMLISSPLVPLPGGTWIDPCAGTGRIPAVINGARDDVTWILTDIDERHQGALYSVIRLAAPGARKADQLLSFGDFVTRPWPFDRADVLVMNPPFSHALDFVRVAMNRACVVVMLQRLNWLGPARADWLRSHQPDTLVLPKRPSFTGDGSTDATEYAWFVWRNGGERRTGTIAMLDAAPRQASLFGGAA